MDDASLVGTQRLTAKVEAYHDGREPDGHPDEIVEVEVFAEADGTIVTDPERIAQIVAAQAWQQGAES